MRNGTYNIIISTIVNRHSNTSYSFLPLLHSGMPIITEDIQASVIPAEVTAGSNVQLKCTVSGDSVYVFLHWVHPVVGVINKSTGRFIFGNTFGQTLTVLDMRESDGGEYMCVFSTPLAEYAQKVEVQYRYPVSFLSSAGQTFSYFVGDSAQIECLAEHHDIIQWQFTNRSVIFGIYRQSAQ